MDTEALIKPSDLRPPTAWLVPCVSTRTVALSDEPDDTAIEPVTIYVATDVEAVRLAAEQVIAGCKPRPSTEAKITAAQLVAHYVAVCQPLPAVVLQALAAAMTVTRQAWAKKRTEPDWRTEAEAEELARLLMAVKQTAAERRRLFDIIRWFHERDRPLPLLILHAVAVALGLTERSGDLRQPVREAVAPTPVGEVRVVGLRIGGRDYRLNEELPDIDPDTADAEFLFRERPAEPRVGMRSPEPYLRAVKTEAMARAKTGKLGKHGMSYQELADEIGEEFNTIRTWASTEKWEIDVQSQAYWMRNRDLYGAALEAEAAARAGRGIWNEPALAFHALAKEIGVDEDTIRKWASTRWWRREAAARAETLTQGQPSRTAESN